MKLPKLPGRGESEEEKQERQMRKKASIQDSMNTGSLEQAAVQQSQERKTGSNELLNPEQDKQRIKQLLLNVEPVQVKPKVLMCNSCGHQHQKEVDECQSCGEEELKVRQGEPRIEWRDAGGEQLINLKGFQKVVWTEVDAAINATVSGGYLSNGEIAKLNYSTLSTITIQLALYPWRYGVANSSDMQQIGDVMRPILAANTSKARGGRGLQNQEKTVVEKISRALGDEDSDEDDGLIF